MKLHADTNPSLNTVTAYGNGYIEVNGQRHQGTVAFGPEGPVTLWPLGSPAEITSAQLLEMAGVADTASDPFAEFSDEADKIRPAAAGSTEVLLIGTGARQEFLRPDVLRPLLRAGVGVESMDTQAAARTYNILMAEGRRVVVVLLPT